MNFFEELAALSDGLDLTLRIKSKDGKITVSVLPDTGGDIAPLIVIGTAQELDEQFIEVIRQPLEETKGIVTNVTEYKKSVKEMEDKEKAKTKPVKKDEKKVPAKPAATKNADKADPEDEDGDEQPEDSQEPEKAEGTQPQSMF